VKPLHLNLASRPYRDYRPVYAAVVAMSLITAFLMLNNVETYYRYTRDTRSTRAKIASIEAQTQQERQREQTVKQRIKHLDLGRLSAQTTFVNNKLAERAFSWSTLLDELESVMVDDVRLVSVAPTFGDKGTIQLSLAFISKSGDGMIRTINRMNSDPQFAYPFPNNQSVIKDGGGYSFGLTVTYLPPPISTGVRLTETSR
jgi:hypothetical protein